MREPVPGRNETRPTPRIANPHGQPAWPTRITKMNTAHPAGVCGEGVRMRPVREGQVRSEESANPTLAPITRRPASSAARCLGHRCCSSRASRHHPEGRPGRCQQGGSGSSRGWSRNCRCLHRSPRGACRWPLRRLRGWSSCRAFLVRSRSSGTPIGTPMWFAGRPSEAFDASRGVLGTIRDPCQKGFGSRAGPAQLALRRAVVLRDQREATMRAGTVRGASQRHCVW